MKRKLFATKVVVPSSLFSSLFRTHELMTSDAPCCCLFPSGPLRVTLSSFLTLLNDKRQNLFQEFIGNGALVPK